MYTNDETNSIDGDYPEVILDNGVSVRISEEDYYVSFDFVTPEGLPQTDGFELKNTIADYKIEIFNCLSAYMTISPSDIDNIFNSIENLPPAPDISSHHGSNGKGPGGGVLQV